MLRIDQHRYKIVSANNLDTSHKGKWGGFVHGHQCCGQCKWTISGRCEGTCKSICTAVESHLHKMWKKLTLLVCDDNLEEIDVFLRSNPSFFQQPHNGLNQHLLLVKTIQKGNHLILHRFIREKLTIETAFKWMNNVLTFMVVNQASCEVFQLVFDNGVLLHLDNHKQFQCLMAMVDDGREDLLKMGRIDINIVNGTETLLEHYAFQPDYDNHIIIRRKQKLLLILKHGGQLGEYAKNRQLVYTKIYTLIGYTKIMILLCHGRHIRSNPLSMLPIEIIREVSQILNE